MLPQESPSALNTASTLPSSVTSQGSTSFEPWSSHALVMPQAMERLLATPNTMPRLPAINLAASAIDPPVPEMTALYIREAPGPEGFSTLLHPSPIGEGGRQLA